MTSTTLHIEGMSCGHCLNAVNKALAAVPGVTIESVQIGRAQVTHDPAAAPVPAIIAAVEAAGFRATAA
jgi:copper chaperone